MIPLEEWDYNNTNLSSYFVLYFYLRESLGKVFCFRRAKKVEYEYVDVSSKLKLSFNSYFASIYPIQNIN